MSAPYIAAMLALSWCLIAGSAAAANPESTAATTPATTGLVDPAAADVLTLEQERYRRLTLPVSVNGSGPFAFLIDTGSQATAITQEIKTSLALESAGTATLVGMASRREVELAKVARIDIGANSFTDFDAPVLARAHVGADGIIGLDALQDFRVLLDFRKQTIAVEDTSGKATNAGFEIIVRARQQLGQLLITDALVEGVRATVIIDTGAQASLGNNALRERIRSKRASEIVTTDVNGVDLVGQVAVVRSLAIEGLALTDVPLAFADTPAFAALGLADKPVLSLGMQHLALFDRVAIDFARQRILFDVPRDVARAIREAKNASRITPRF